MLEIEMKFPAADFAPVIAGLQKLGARVGASRTETDHYFNAPHRDFAQTDEALRIRRSGTTNRVTYKGPRLPGPDKTRAEIEVSLGDGDGTFADFARVLTSLGFRPTAIVSKHRTGYDLRHSGFDLEICLDEVAHVGRFVELEILAAEDALEHARATLQEVARALGLANSERRSYLELLLLSAASPHR